MERLPEEIQKHQEAEALRPESEKGLTERTGSVSAGNERFNLIAATLDKLLEGVQIIGFDWKYIYVNDSMARHGKYKKEELIGHTVMEKYPGIEHTEVFGAYRRCFEQRVSVQMENEFLFPDKSMGWFELSFQPVPEGIFILSVDITARKKAELALQESEARFRTMIEQSNDIIAIADENFTVFYRSPSAYRITGLSPEEREQAGGLEQTHPDDLPHLREAFRQSLEKPGLPVKISFRTRHKEGHFIWLEGVMTNLLHEPAIHGIVSNLNDVTERKKAEGELMRSEEIYRTIASSIPGSVICILDKEYRYLLIEGDMLGRMGYSKERLLGHKMKDVVPVENYTRVLPSLQRVFRGEAFTIESSGPGYDSASRYVPLKGEDNDVYACMIFLFDVSELKNAQRHIAQLNTELEQKVIERTQQLEEANKELESFSYSVSHDLRAPLRAIGGYSSILVEDYSGVLDKEGRRIAGLIISNAKKMGQLIDDLLNFSRVGRAGINPSEVNMTAQASSAVAELLSSETASRYVIKINELPEAYADPAMIKQVWMNFVDNAIKYTSKKTEPVIEIGSCDDELNNIYFIKDNGAGFDMQYAHKLFGVFQRLHSASEFAGTGVGLALVNRIIQKHNGSVWTEAIEDEGATFFFSLPKMIAHEQQR